MSAGSQDAAGEQALSGAVDQLMKAATAPKAKAQTTALTLSVAAPDRKSLSRSQVAALNRGQVVLARVFDVSVEYGQTEESDENKTPAEAGEAA
jgi:hypothetical protein